MGNMAEHEDLAADTETQQWRWISYDVWGNAEDGYQINNAFTTSSYFEIPKDATYEQVIALVGFIEPDKVEIDGNMDTEETMCFRLKDDWYPVGEIRLVKEVG